MMPLGMSGRGWVEDARLGTGVRWWWQGGGGRTSSPWTHVTLWPRFFLAATLICGSAPFLSTSLAPRATRCCGSMRLRKAGASLADATCVGKGSPFFSTPLNSASHSAGSSWISPSACAQWSATGKLVRGSYGPYSRAALCVASFAISIHIHMYIHMTRAT